jgi:hypothetical protein
LRWNAYTYALSNPIKYFDPNGQDEYLFTWVPTARKVGHSAVGWDERDANGNKTGRIVTNCADLTKSAVEAVGVATVSKNVVRGEGFGLSAQSF